MTISTVWVPYPETLTIIGTKATTGMDRMSKAAGVSRPLKTGAVQDKQAVTKPSNNPKARPPDAVRVVRAASTAKNSASLMSANRTALGDGATMAVSYTHLTLPTRS